MVSYVLLNWCHLRFDACEKDPPFCILHLPADSPLCTCASNRTKDEKPDQIPKPTSKREGQDWLGLKKYLVGHETDLVAGTGLVTAGNSSPAWTTPALFLYKWQQCIEISYTYFEAILALNKQSSIFSPWPSLFRFNRYFPKKKTYLSDIDWMVGWYLQHIQWLFQFLAPRSKYDQEKDGQQHGPL